MLMHKLPLEFINDGEKEKGPILCMCTHLKSMMKVINTLPYDSEWWAIVHSGKCHNKDDLSIGDIRFKL